MKNIQELIKEINTRLNYWDSVKDKLAAMNGSWKGTESDFWYSMGAELMEKSEAWKGNDMITNSESEGEINGMLNYWDSIRREFKALDENWEKDVITISSSQRERMILEISVKQSTYMDTWVVLNDELNSTKEKEQVTGAEVLRPKLYSLKFYADGAGGVSDKLFCYPVHHGGHTADLLTRLIKSGLTIKAAYLVGGRCGMNGVQLSRGELAYLTCTGEKEKNRIRAILMSKFPELN